METPLVQTKRTSVWDVSLHCQLQRAVGNDRQPTTSPTDFFPPPSSICLSSFSNDRRPDSLFQYTCFKQSIKQSTMTYNTFPAASRAASASATPAGPRADRAIVPYSHYGHDLRGQRPLCFYCGGPHWAVDCDRLIESGQQQCIGRQTINNNVYLGAQPQLPPPPPPPPARPRRRRQRQRRQKRRTQRARAWKKQKEEKEKEEKEREEKEKKEKEKEKEERGDGVLEMVRVA